MNHTLSAVVLLDLWENCRDQPPGLRARTLLAGCTGRPADSLAGLTVGQRDRALSAVRRALFGSRVRSLADCPCCETTVELDLDLADLTAAVSPPPEPVLTHGAVQVTWRLPRAGDMAAVAGMTTSQAAQEELLRRCVSEVRAGDEVLPRAAWPEEALTAVEEAMARADPQADVWLALCCPECGEKWQAGFDVATFLWVEVDRLARGLLREVHVLASAYGWTEAEVLALSATRRATYLELCAR
jgi:hypothetical protein